MSEWNIQALRAQERKHIPVVLTQDEINCHICSILFSYNEKEKYI